MSIVAWVYLCSALGALLFFAAGWLSGSGRSAPLTLASPLDAGDNMELEALSRQLGAAQSGFTQESQARVVAEDRARAAEAAARESVLLRAEVETLRQAAGTTEEAEPTRVDRSGALSKENEHLRDEVAQLKRRQNAVINEKKQLEKELSAAKKPSAAAPMIAPAGATHMRRPSRSVPSVPVVGSGAKTTEGSLQQILSNLVKSGDRQAAVLADARGLLVAAFGPPHFHDPLGALSSLMADVAERAAEYLPLAGVSRVKILDTGSLELATDLFRWDDEFLALTTIGNIQSSTDPAIDEAMQGITRIIAA